MWLFRRRPPQQKMSQLESRASVKKRKALRLLGERGDETAIGPLIDVIVTGGEDEWSPGIAAVALDVLDGRGYTVAPELLFDALARIQPDLWLNDSSFHLPTLYGNKRHRDLTRHERSEVASMPTSSIVLNKIIQLLRAHVDPRHIPALLQLMEFTYAPRPSYRDPSGRKVAREHGFRMRTIGYQVLPFIDDAAAVDALVDHIRRHPEDGEARAALGRAVRPDALDVLVEFLANPPSGIPDVKVWLARADFARALGRRRDPRALEPLLSWFDEPQGGSDGLAEFGGPAVVAAMITRLRSPDLRKAESAVYVLGRIGDEAAVGPILAFLDRHDWQSRTGTQAIEALGRIGGRRTVTALCAKLRPLDADNAGFMARIAQALQYIGDPTALNSLRAIDPGPVNVSTVEIAEKNKAKYVGSCYTIYAAISSLSRKSGGRG